MDDSEVLLLVLTEAELWELSEKHLVASLHSRGEGV